MIEILNQNESKGVRGKFRCSSCGSKKFKVDVTVVARTKEAIGEVIRDGETILPAGKDKVAIPKILECAECGGTELEVITEDGGEVQKPNK